jgi:breast cancer 2 susceptibility protein
MYDQLEDASDAEVARTFTRLGATDAGWLARYIRDAIIKEREHAGYEIERELMVRTSQRHAACVVLTHDTKHACPPREVRDFRILLVRDADAHRRPAHRKAQITVWGALGLAESAEGQGGGFREDQRFRVSTSHASLALAC